MLDLQKVQDTKDKIASIIKNNGPSYPAKISRETGVSPLFVSAILSEMVSEKRLTMSNMRVGSSPLYYSIGQESQLENFLQFLNHKEREAVLRLKEQHILTDEKEDPAIRVALRKVRDFAVPLNVRIDAEEKLFWKFFTISDNDAREKLGQLLNPPVQQKPAQKETKETPVRQEVVKKEPISQVVATPKKEKKETKKVTQFTKNVQDYLQGKDIELLAELSVKPKEYHAKIRIDTPFGKQEYLLMAKDKKKITEDDLAIALHKAQAEKMPSFILSSGTLDKSAQSYLESWKNLLKVEHLK